MLQRLWRHALHRQHTRLHLLVPQRIQQERLLAATIRIQRLHRRWQRLVLWRQLVYDSWDRAFDAAVCIQTRWRQALARRHVARLRYLRDEVYFPFGHDFAQSDLVTNLAAFGIVFDQETLHGRGIRNNHGQLSSHLAGLVRYPDQNHHRQTSRGKGHQQDSLGSDPPSLEILHMLQLPDAPPNCLFASGSAQGNGLTHRKPSNGHRDSSGSYSGCFQHVPLSWSAFHQSESTLDIGLNAEDEIDQSASVEYHTTTNSNGNVANDGENEGESRCEKKQYDTEGNGCSVDYTDILSTILFPYHQHNPRQPHSQLNNPPTATRSTSSCAAVTTTETQLREEDTMEAKTSSTQHSNSLPVSSTSTVSKTTGVPVHHEIESLFQGYDNEVYLPMIGGSLDKSAHSTSNRQTVRISDMLLHMLPPSLLSSSTRLVDDDMKEGEDRRDQDRLYNTANDRDDTRWTEEESTRWIHLSATSLATNNMVDSTEEEDNGYGKQKADADQFSEIRRLRQRGLFAPVYEYLASRGI